MRRVASNRCPITIEQCIKGHSIVQKDVIAHSPLSGYIKLKSFRLSQTNSCAAPKPIIYSRNLFFSPIHQQKRFLSTQTQVDEKTDEPTRQEVSVQEDSEDFQSHQIQDILQRQWFLQMQSFYTKKQYQKALNVFDYVRKQAVCYVVSVFLTVKVPPPLMYKLAMHCDCQLLDNKMLLEHANMFLKAHGTNISVLSHILQHFGYYQKPELFDMFWKVVENKDELLPTDASSSRRLVLGFSKLRRAEVIRAYMEKKRQEYPQHMGVLDCLIFLHHHIQQPQQVVDLASKAMEASQAISYYSLRKAAENALKIGDWKHHQIFSEAMDAIQKSGTKVPVLLRLRGLFATKDYQKMVQVFNENFGDLDSYLVPHTDPRKHIPQQQIASRMMSAYGALYMEKELLACYNFFMKMDDPNESVIRAMMLYYSKKHDVASVVKVFNEALDKDLARGGKPRNWIFTSAITSLIYCMQMNKKIPELLEILERLRTIPHLESVFYQHNIYVTLLPVLIDKKDDKNALKWLQYYYQRVRYPRIAPAKDFLTLLIQLGKGDEAQAFVSALESVSETKPDREMYHSLITMWGKQNNSEKIYEVTKLMTLLGVYPTVKTHMIIVDILARHKRFKDLVEYYKAVAPQDTPELKKTIVDILTKNKQHESLQEVEQFKIATA